MGREKENRGCPGRVLTRTAMFTDPGLIQAQKGPSASPICQVSNENAEKTDLAAGRGH